jgi:hypothetical protein
MSITKGRNLPCPPPYCVAIKGQPIKLPLVGDGGGCDIALGIFHLLTPRGRERIGEVEKERRKRQNEKKIWGGGSCSRVLTSLIFFFITPNLTTIEGCFQQYFLLFSFSHSRLHKVPLKFKFL